MHLRKHLHKTDGHQDSLDEPRRTCPVVRIGLISFTCVNAYPKSIFLKVWSRKFMFAKWKWGLLGLGVDEGPWCGPLIGRWWLRRSGKPSGWKWPLSNRNLMSFILWISISLSLYTNFSLVDVTDKGLTYHFNHHRLWISQFSQFFDKDLTLELCFKSLYLGGMLRLIFKLMIGACPVIGWYIWSQILIGRGRYISSINLKTNVKVYTLTKYI